MATDMMQPATLGNLQRVVENLKVYVDSDSTISIKGHNVKNNTHCFYNTKTPTEDTTPIFSFDIAEEMFLDQAKTKFVPNFVWSAETYVGSTDPSLDGKPVMVLAVKGDESVTYSFLNLEELVDTITTKDTSSLSLSISEDGEISGDVKVSEKEGNTITIEEDGLYATGGGTEPLVVDFRYKSNGEGYEAYDFTHTNAEIIEAINNDRTVIMKGLINTARDYAPYVFQLHTYMKNSGRYEFVYSTFSNYMEITEYKIVVYNNDNLEFLVNTYKVNQTIPEIPYGDEGQFISFDEEGYLIAVDAPTGGGTEPFLVTFYFSATSMSLLQNANKTYAEISSALDEGKVVILKGIDTSQSSQQFYYFNVAKYDKKNSQIIFTYLYHTYGSGVKPEIWYYLLGAGHMIGKYTIDLSNYALTEDLDNYVEKEEGKGLSTNDLTDELLEVIEGDHRYAGISVTTETDLNNIKTAGLYNMDTTAGSYTNAPSGVTRFMLEVTTHTRYVIQKAFGIYASTTASATRSTPATYVRMYDTMLYSWTSWEVPNGITPDSVLTSTSTNVVQNKVIYEALEGKLGKDETAASATKLANQCGIFINLSSNSTAQFDGTDSVNPGVFGTLPITRGGTGANNARDAANNLLNAMEVGDSAPTEAANIVVQGNGDYSNKYYLKPISMLWSLIKDKISSVLGLTETNYNGNAASATKLANQCGILVNLGSFTTGYLDGTVPVEPGIQGTLPIEAGGTGASTISDARSKLNVPPTNHASAGTTYGKGGPTSYGHLKVSDEYEQSPNTGHNASNAVAASLYSAQRLNARLIDLETEMAGYSLVGTVTFGITMQSNSVSTACTISNNDGTLPFTKGGGGTNTTAYFKPSQAITYACKFKRKHAQFVPSVRCGTSIPTATSVTPTGTQCLTSAAMATPTGELADVAYEDIAFSTSNYYYAYHSGGPSSGVSYADRGGVLYCYTKG